MGRTARSSPALRSSGTAAGPRPPARWPAREGGGRDAGLAVMAAVGIWIGRADEGSLRLAGSPPRAFPGAARPCSAGGAEAWVVMAELDARWGAAPVMWSLTSSDAFYYGSLIPRNVCRACVLCR